MNPAAKQMVSAMLVVVAAAGFVGWWVYGQTASPALTATPAVTSTISPLTSPLIDTLRSRQIYGDLPVNPLDASSRTDPFVQQ